MTSDHPESTAVEIPTGVTTQTSPAPVLAIEEGFVHKRGPRPLRLWQKRYFRLPAENHAYPLHKLRLVYRKNAKKQNAAKEDFEKTNKCLLETLATATVNSTSVLAYFRSEDKDELPQGFINLKQVNDIFPSPKIRPFAFTIKTHSRDYVFSSNSQSDTDSWISTLKSLSSSEIPDFSHTAAYQFSYSQLVDRKGFASPSAPAQDDEVFSASEAELDSDDIIPREPVESTKPDLTIEVPSSESPAAESKPSTVRGEPTDGNMSPRKSFYNEVLDFFYRKGPDGEQIREVKEASAQEPRESVAADVTEVTEVTEDVPSASVVEQEEVKASEFSQEIAEMVAPISSDPPVLEPTPAVSSTIEAASTENRPTRTKTFVMPKFEGKMFSKIFKKNNSEQSTSKDEILSASEETSKDIVCDAVPKVLEEPTIVGGTVPSVDEVAVINVVEPEVAECANEVAPETAPEVEVIALVGADETISVVPEVVKSEEVAPVEIESTVEEIIPVSNEVKDVEETVVDAIPEPVVITQEKTQDEDNRPFLTRLLSGKRKSKVVETPIPVEDVQIGSNAEIPSDENEIVSSVAPVEDKVISADVVSEQIPEEVTSQEEVIVDAPKQPFIKRLLSGNFKTKNTDSSVPSIDDNVESSEPIVEPIAEPLPVSEIKDSEPIVSEIESEVKTQDEIVEEPASIEPVEKEIQTEVVDKKTDIPAPQRQASLMARIGELAYSAVAPTSTVIPEENEDEISELYDEKINEAVHTGFLYKQSYLLHTNNLRFFILGKDGVLTYYRSAKVISDGKKIIVNDTTEVSAVEELLLNLKSSNGTVNYFQAKTKEDRDAWVKALSAFAKPAPVEVVENVEAASEAAIIAPEATTIAPEANDSSTTDIVPAVVAEIV